MILGPCPYSNCSVSNRLKKGTWKRAYNKSWPRVFLPLKNALGPKRRSKELLSDAEKTECAKKKSKLSNNESLQFLSREEQIILAEVAMQPRRAL